MSQLSKIHQAKRPGRIHYFVEWAERRDLSQADIARELGVDKGTVSRWFAGNLPELPNLIALAGLLGADEVNDLFHDPEDNWLKRFFIGRAKDEVTHIQKSMEITFPRKSGVGGG